MKCSAFQAIFTTYLPWSAQLISLRKIIPKYLLLLASAINLSINE